MNEKVYLLVAFLVTYGHYSREVYSLSEFTNVKCESLDKDYGDFAYCHLKSVNRTYKYLSIKYKLFQPPITKVKVNFAFYQRLNGFKPFLYNVTVDACRFLKHPKYSPVTKFLYDIFKDISNMNHSCPFNDDLWMEKLTAERMNHHFTHILPFSKGDYMIHSQWIFGDIHRAVTKIYFSIL